MVGSKRIRWPALSKRLAERWPDARFQAGPIRDNTVEVELFARPPIVAVPPFWLTIDGVKLRVVVVVMPLAPFSVAPGLGLTGGISFTGVHPGAAIAIDHTDGVRHHGGICALLARSATASRPTHLLTCGHIFEKGEESDVIAADGPNSDEVVIGTLISNLLEKQIQRDVALVELSDDGASIALAGGGPRLKNASSAVTNLRSRTYQPTLAGFSTWTKTAAKTVNAHVPSTTWAGGFDVQGVIGTLAKVSSPGDSGTVLLADTGDGVGSCTASDGGKSIFEPLARALTAFESKFHLKIWRNP